MPVKIANRVCLMLESSKEIIFSNSATSLAAVPYRACLALSQTQLDWWKVKTKTKKKRKTKPYPHSPLSVSRSAILECNRMRMRKLVFPLHCTLHRGFPCVAVHILPFTWRARLEWSRVCICQRNVSSLQICRSPALSCMASWASSTSWPQEVRLH